MNVNGNKLIKGKSKASSRIVITLTLLGYFCFIRSSYPTLRIKFYLKRPRAKP